jgi:lipoprotein-anchoring transpeptidase ErfK/SrfK
VGRIWNARQRLADLTALLTVAALSAACTSGATRPVQSPTPPDSTSAVAAAPSSSTSMTAASPARTARPSPTLTVKRGSGAPVHVRLYEGDGQTYGVGMPIIAYFSAMLTDASAFDTATAVSADGKPVRGAWYWERSGVNPGEPLEAHYRLAQYWPGHATITLNLPVAGLTAGKGLVFDDSLTLTMKTGAAHVATVDGRPGVDKMVIYSDHKLVKILPVSLGEATTPTYLGTKVVMEKDNPQQMVSAPGEPYYSISVPWSVRVTYSGEFIHDAYWNGQLGQQNLSHGCTNLSPTDAEWYYNWSLIGDPVSYAFTGTSAVVPTWDGYGDWNVSWRTYQRGGLLSPTG